MNISNLHFSALLPEADDPQSVRIAKSLAEYSSLLLLKPDSINPGVSRIVSSFLTMVGKQLTLQGPSSLLVSTVLGPFVTALCALQTNRPIVKLTDNDIWELLLESPSRDQLGTSGIFPPSPA